MQPAEGARLDSGAADDALDLLLQNLLAQLPESFDVPPLRRALGETPLPTQLVFIQELERWNAVGAFTSNVC